MLIQKKNSTRHQGLRRREEGFRPVQEDSELLQEVSDLRLYAPRNVVNLFLSSVVV